MTIPAYIIAPNSEGEVFMRIDSFLFREGIEEIRRIEKIAKALGALDAAEAQKGPE